MEKNNIYEKYNILSKENERLSIMNLKYRNRLLKLNTSTASMDSAASSLSALLKRPIFDVFPNLPMSTVSSTVMGKFIEKGVSCGI